MTYYVTLYQSDYGWHEIPKEFLDIKLTVNGQPDKRSKLYKKFIEWVNTLNYENVCTIRR